VLEAEVTAAVNVTTCPGEDGLADDVIVVVVPVTDVLTGVIVTSFPAPPAY
jgi:hypothetical protein